MKGLIIKDFLLLGKTIKLYAIILGFYAVFSISTGNASFFGSMVAIFSAMLPITALAYDERAKWDRYALTMPVTRKDIVLSKYYLGAMLCVAGLIFSFVSLVFAKDMTFEEKIFTSLFMMSLGLLYQAIVLPLMFKFGTEKGRIYMMIAFFAPAVIVMLLVKFVDVNVSINVNTIENVIKFSPIVAIGLWLISMKLSLMFYNQQKQ